MRATGQNREETKDSIMGDVGYGLSDQEERVDEASLKQPETTS